MSHLKSVGMIDGLAPQVTLDLQLCRGISEYSVSETTLEQLFIQFAKHQAPLASMYEYITTLNPGFSNPFRGRVQGLGAGKGLSGLGV